jgi:hypothetical protein
MPFLRRYLYAQIARWLSVLILREDTFCEEHPPEGGGVVPLDQGTRTPLEDADYVVLNGTLHYESDIQAALEALRVRMKKRARLLVVYYNAWWQPLVRLAGMLGLRAKRPEENWLDHGDIENLLSLAGFELVRRDARVLLPLYIPLLSAFVNRWLAPLPGLNWLALFSVAQARIRPVAAAGEGVSASVVVPARNESGNIRNIVTRYVPMGPHDQLIFVEGNSTDDTWEEILKVKAELEGKLPFEIVTCQQEGKGKGDAVRKGFSIATREVLMILDADLTVPPEDLPKFFRALTGLGAEFVNGSRLVYPQEKQAMRFLNMLGNKFFAKAFSFTLGQRYKDTLCGTKVLWRSDYEKLAARRGYFGDFDPFGDFDLILGAARMGLKVVEIPIRYKERTYGETNIQRWRHGWLLLKMTGFAARKIKFV